MYDSLDERCAVKNFVGKSQQEAELMFRENFLTYQEDLMWMGPVAFAYYLVPAMNYLKSIHSNGDSDAVSCFCNLIAFKLEWEKTTLLPVMANIFETIEIITKDFHRFECVEEIYGDVKNRLLGLKLAMET
ncbi:MAG: hypothetical protein ACKO85_13130 [Isosphaeraceae bacterium]